MCRALKAEGRELFMTWIKICGITNLEDALLALEAGADALGFVFYEKSPRNVDVETVRAIVEELPKNVEKVGVFVENEDWLRIFNEAGLSAVQHVLIMDGSSQGWQRATGAAVLPQPLRAYTSFPIGDFLQDEGSVKALAADFARMRRQFPDGPPIQESVLDTFFLDSGNGEKPGGTGRPFDWRKAVPIAEAMRQNRLKLVVAGGLNCDNVAEAIEILEPWGVDVSSGVEARPGKKDPEKVRAFVRAVRRAEKSA